MSDDKLHIIFAGQSGVGKSALMQAVMGLLIELEAGLPTKIEGDTGFKFSQVHDIVLKKVLAKTEISLYEIHTYESAHSGEEMMTGVSGDLGKIREKATSYVKFGKE